MSRADKNIRNEDLRTLSTAELLNRLAHGNNMHKRVQANKARRAWKETIEKLQAELEQRQLEQLTR